MNTNTIEVNLNGNETVVVAPEIRWNQDITQYLKITGITLPEQYQVDFANIGDDKTITMIGGADGVQIPDQLISGGSVILAYLYLQTGEESWNTMVKIEINVLGRPERSGIQPTPSEQSTIDSLIAAMNRAVASGVGIPAGGTEGQVLTKKSDEDFDAEWKDEEGGGGGLFEVNITGSSNTRTSDKTPKQIKDAVDAGMMVIANIAAGDTKAYLYQSTANRAEFRTLPMTGLANEYSSMMWQEFNLSSQNTTTVNVTYTSVTSAATLVDKVQPHISFDVEWNDGDYYPQMAIWLSESEWHSFYYGDLGTVVAYLKSYEYVNGRYENSTYISRKVWMTEEYDPDYGGDVTVGNIIFVHTEIDGQTLRTTEITWKHYIWNNRMEITNRTIAETTVTATSDIPQKWDPQ